MYPNALVMTLPYSASKGLTDFTTTPTSFSGKLLRINFHSDSAINPTDGKFPPDCWFLRSPAGSNEDEYYQNGGTVEFDLTKIQNVSQGFANLPQASGFGVYHSLFLEFTYVDVGFDLADVHYDIRVCASDRDGCIRGDIMMKDSDGLFKWISSTGDPNELLGIRPSDPVLDAGLAAWASGWAVGDTSASIFVTEAAIPDNALFDVPDINYAYKVILDFELANVVCIRQIDTSNYSRRDILQKLVINNFVGKGGDNHLTIIPTVEVLGP